MSFPATSREVYEKNPLREVVCQLHFPSILVISAESPVEFQEGIRADYPVYRKKAVPAPNIIGSLPGDIPPEVAELIASSPFPFGGNLVEHHFGTPDGQTTISLTQEFVSISEQRYSRWEDFGEKVRLAESVLQQTYKPAFFDRVGLRYIDVLDRKECGLEDTPWSELLNGSFISVLGSEELADDVSQLTVQSMLRVPDVDQGQVFLRHGLLIKEGSDEQTYVIDADFHTNARSNSNDVFQALDKFHRWAGNLFRWATSTKLREALGPTRI